jgi:hypothetical protein
MYRVKGEDPVKKAIDSVVDQKEKLREQLKK